MNICRLLRCLVIVCAVAFLPEASALKCAPPQHDMDSIRERLTYSEWVVLGRIEVMGKALMLGDWSPGALATVRVQRTFRGNTPRTLEMYVNPDLTVGQRVVFYVHKESADEAKRRVLWVNPFKKPPGTGAEFSEQPQLRANSACGDNHVLADSEAGRAHLMHLNALPPTGSGGTLRLRIEAHNKRSGMQWGENQTRLSRMVVTLKRDATSITATTDENGEVVFDQLPAGHYAVQLPKVDGFTLKCSSYPASSCEAMPVADLALHRNYVSYNPNAAVQFSVLNADGRPSDAVASFRLTLVHPAATDNRRGAPFQAPTTVLANTAGPVSGDGTLRGHVTVVPGNYHVELLLDEVEGATATEANGYASFQSVRRQRIKNAGADLQDLSTGNNAIAFKLPAKLAPKTITVRISTPGGKLQDTPRLNASLLAEDGEGRIQRLTAYNSTKELKGETGWTLTAIPGQTWLLSASDYKSGLEAETLLRVTEDVTITLPMIAKRIR